MKRSIEEVIEGWLEDYTLEDLFDELGLDPSDVVHKMYLSGAIDENLLDGFLGVDEIEFED
jgi:hypothetical protein